MEQQKISHTQLCALLWGAVLAPAVEWLPGEGLEQAGRAAWLSGVLALPWLLAGVWLWRGVFRRGGVGVLRRRWGGWSVPLYLIYIMWCAAGCAVRLALCARRLAGSGLRDGSDWFFLLTMGAVLVWVAWGRLPALARAGEILLWVLAATAVCVLLLALPHSRWERALPVWGEDLPGALRAGLDAARCLCWGSFAGLLCGDAEREQIHAGRRWLGWAAAGCAALSAGQLVILAGLGTRLAGQVYVPFFTLAKNVGVEGAFQRGESVVVAVWTLSDLLLAAGLVFAARRLLEQLHPRLAAPSVGGGTAAVCVLLAGALLAAGAGLGWYNRVLAPAAHAFAALLVPVFVKLTDFFPAGGGRKSTSCGDRGK